MNIFEYLEHLAQHEWDKLFEWMKHHPKHRHPVELVLTTIVNNFKIRIMAVSIASNQQVAGQLSLVDQVTGANVSATFTNVTAVSDTPAAATASVDSSNNVDVVGVAPGTGNVTVTALTAYTDSTGAPQSTTETFVVPFTITAVTTADAVSLVVTFGAPTAQ
jgi:hypothetical protein